MTKFYNELESYSLNQEQKDVIVGSLLGDGNLQSFTKGKTWRYRALGRIKIQQANHVEYIEYKYKVLQPLCRTGLIYEEVLDKRSNKSARRYYFNTKVSPCFKHYGNLFYSFNPETGRFLKRIPKTIQQILTPRSLAILYQDDGSFHWKGHGNSAKICVEIYLSQNFPKDDILRLIKAINSLYDINTKIVSHRKGYRIFIPESSALSFFQLIRPYMIPCMLYKIKMTNNINCQI
jgi:hypothetical protein